MFSIIPNFIRLDPLEPISPPKTSLTTPHDLKMASLQTVYHTLPPSAKLEQELWAQEQLKEKIPPCPGGYTWLRQDGKNSSSKVKDMGGYKCNGGHHFVSDALLAEGRGGYIEFQANMIGWSRWRGPFYKGWEKREVGDSGIGGGIAKNNKKGKKKDDGKGKGRGKGKWDEYRMFLGWLRVVIRSLTFRIDFKT